LIAGAVAASAGAFNAVRSRLRRDQELAATRADAADAQRLRLALDAGEMGTWRWDLRSGRVEWDTRLEALFGLEPGSFDGEFTTYESLLHPEDRVRALAAVRDGMERKTPWRFDHRVMWPDDTTHWLEGRGEPVVDDQGVVIGATGVTINVDRRHALFDVSAALARTSSVDEVGAVIVDRAVQALRARSGYFATVDEQTDELVMRAQSNYPDWIVRKYERVDLSAPVPGAEAIRTARPIFIESAHDRSARYPQYAEDPAHAAFVVVPLPPIDGTRAVVAFGFAEERRFDDDDRHYINVVVDSCAQALQRANAFEAEHAARARLRTLLDGSEQLAALDDPDLVVETIARVAATRIGNWASVTVMEDDGRLERVATVGAVKTRLADDTASLQHVFDTGAPLLSQSESITCLLVPISIVGRRLAVLSIGLESAAGFRPADVELAVDLGRRGGSALERAQLWQASQQQLEAEHRIVELLQRTIVPDRLPDLKAVQLAAAYRPAELDVDVGGDWYDAFVAPDGSLITVVGDVAGHGIQAASLMGRVRNALRAYAIEDTEPASILMRLHLLLRSLDSSEMVTAFVARHVPGSEVMTWSRAGHPPPLLVDRRGSMRWLDDVNGAPIGTMARRYETAEVTLPEGSLLVCYTDGLVERRDRVLDDGLAWLALRVCENADEDLGTLCDKLFENPFVPHPSPDDVCVLLLRTE
jgi:serine phosphatase RsbU (regulator of sigma subunit)/PAS domain-containing protein